MTPEQLQAHLMEWLDQGVVMPAPSPNESSLVYLIFPPLDTKMSLPGESGWGGFHWHGSWRAAGADSNLFWATVRDYSPSLTGAGAGFVDSISYIVSHELVEAFSDRDGYGYFGTYGCEIGDLCEADPPVPVTTVSYYSWQVERYWSQRQ
jgi:hypothetical protein